MKMSNKSIKLRNDKIAYLMMSPYLVLFIILTVIPVAVAIVLGFTYFNMLEPPVFIGLDNFKRMFLEDDIFPKILKNTLLFALLTGPISYFLSFFIAWMISDLPRIPRSILTLCFYSSTLTGNLYVTWNYIFSGNRYGILNSVIIGLGFTKQPIQWLSDPKYMMISLVVIQMWLSIGSVGFLTFIAGFQNTDRSLSEAAAIDGVHNRFGELWYITLPSMAPQLMFSAVMQISACFGVGAIVQALCGFPTTNYSADTMLTYMLDVGTVRFEMGYASAIAVVMFALMLISNYVVTHLLRNFSTD